ncbi:MarC family protein [Thermoproteota archaeon]
MGYKFLQYFLQDLFRATIPLFIVVDSLENMAAFISLTENLSKNDRRQAFNMASIVALARAFPKMMKNM